MPSYRVQVRKKKTCSSALDLGTAGLYTIRLRSFLLLFYCPMLILEPVLLEPCVYARDSIYTTG